MTRNSGSDFRTVINIGDPWRRFIELVPEMAEAAVEAAQDQSFSYRNFPVGAAFFVVDSLNGQGAVFDRANTKVKIKNKVCAELKAQRKIDKTPFDQIIGLVVAGTTDVDKIEEVNQVRVPTLWPCHSCTGDLSGNPKVSPDTLIVTTGIGRRAADRIFQIHTFSQIERMYVDGSWDLDGQKTGYDLGYDWSRRRLDLYDSLSLAEQSIAPTMRRSPAQLACLAMLAPLRQ